MRMVARMDLVEGLRCFAAVAAERSFTRGAARCGQPQPVASRRISALEQRLGVTLLLRTSRRVELSPEGERLLPLAGELLARADRIDTLFTAPERSLVIAVPAGLTAAARAAIRRGLPEFTVGFVDEEPPDREELLRSGLAQFAVLPTSPQQAEFTVPLGIAHHDHAPAARFHLDQLRRPVRERDLPPRAVQLLAEDDVATVRDPVAEACYGLGLRADQLVVGTPEAEAWTRVHERGDVVLASAEQARREDLAWSPLARPAVRRSYRLAGSAELDDHDRVELLTRLAAGLGGGRGRTS